MNKKLLPLALLEQSEENSIEGITRFQKLVFLTQEEEIHDNIYRFIAGSYGPYSRSLYDDIDRLVEGGFIEETTEPIIPPNRSDKQIYQLKEKGKKHSNVG